MPARPSPTPRLLDHSYDESVPMTDTERYPDAVEAAWSSGETTEAICGAAFLDGEAAAALVDGARYLFTNEYEAALLLQKTGWSDDEVLSRVGTWVTTRAADGILVRRAGDPAAPTAASAISSGVTGRCGDMLGVWIAPVTAQVMMTLRLVAMLSVSPVPACAPARRRGVRRATASAPAGRHVAAIAA